MSQTVRGQRRIVGRFLALALCSSFALPGLLGTASAQEAAATPSVHPVLFASAPTGTANPDDITRLGHNLYVSYQNDAGSTGNPPGSTSTVVAFDRSSHKVVATYVLTGRCDGLKADLHNGRIFATVNEDNNSSLYVITPGAATPIQHFDYSPSPAETGSDGTNGGTDAVSIGTDGTVYVAHSNPDLSLPDPNNTAAVFTVKLVTSTATAVLTPLFGVNDVAKVINPGSTTTATALGLTDPDSNRFVDAPQGGTLIQVGQADSKLVFAKDLTSGHMRLRQLYLTSSVSGTSAPQVDDIERVKGAGTLYAVDQGSGNIYSIDTAHIGSETWFVAQTAPAPAIAIVDLTTGVVTPVDTTLKNPKGLLFVASSKSGTKTPKSKGGQ